MQKRIFMLLSLLCALTLTGCKDNQTPQISETTQPVTQEITLPASNTSSTETAPSPIPFSFSDLEHYEFLFASGAGGWGTVLYIQPDGSFTGNFRDSESETGPGYPNGAVTYCDFSGKFGAPVPVDTYTYSLPIEQLQYAHQPGTEEIKDGILYRYAAAHGLSGTDALLLYLPGAPTAELPTDFTQWFGYQLTDTEQLPFYGLYDQSNWYCYSGTDVVQEIRRQVAEAEETDAKLYAQLQTAATQADMNTAAYNRFILWDGILNELWQILKQILPEAEMRQLTNEELAWIKEKEQAVADAGAEVEGGSLYPSVTNGLAATMTRDRVYVLLEYLPDNQEN